LFLGEPLRGVRFDLTDVKLHSDRVHRGVSQLIPAATRCMTAALLNSEIGILEPIFKCTVIVPRSESDAVYTLLRSKRATICETEFDGTTNENISSNSIMKIEAMLPVAESFGFNSTLRGATSK
jgi:elongation factor 2